jgi:hypothetical protein
MNHRGLFRNWRALLASFPLCGIILVSSFSPAADNAPKLDPRYPFRTDSANEQLPWYQPKPGEFPPHHSDHRVGGELVEADFIHRTGQFRMNRTGELVTFKLPPYGNVYYLNAEADLRDVPLGTYFLFFLNQDENGVFTRLATMQDQYTMDSGHGFSYRLDQVKLGEGKLVVTKHKVVKGEPDSAPSELIVTGQTRVWKGGDQIKLTDLAIGDELLYNRTGANAQNVSHCLDIWVGADTHKAATEAQRKKHIEFLKVRGVPAWIDSVDGGKLTVTMFSADRASLQGLFKDEGIVPAQWASEHRTIQAVVANEELRSYNPPVDKQRSTVLEARRVPSECYGSSGEQWVIEPSLLLEGFRKGRIVRLFLSPTWPINDMPFGEGLYTETVATETREPMPNQYPYRTDFGNTDLPWYQLKPHEFPPECSDHVIAGELLSADAAHRAGQFRADVTGEVVNFTMPPYGAALYLNSEADLADLPLGTRYRFSLYQDLNGAFTKAAIVMDEYSYLSSQKITYRLDAARLDEGLIVVARKIPPKKNYHGDDVQPPDLGVSELAVDASTRVWKGDRQVKLTDLVPGDELLVNISGCTRTDRGHCTEIWIGADSQGLATKNQRQKHHARLALQGVPAWIDSVDGRKLTVTLFAGVRPDMVGFLGSDPRGKNVFTTRADEDLRPIGLDGAVPGAPVDVMPFRDHLPEGLTAGTYGCSGIRWVLEPKVLPAGYKPGQLIRVFKADWIPAK